MKVHLVTCLTNGNEERHDDVEFVTPDENHPERGSGKQKDAAHGHVTTSELVSKQSG